jgi:hypothetical protein
MTGVRRVRAGDAEEEGQDYQAQTEEPKWARPHSSSVGGRGSQNHGALGLIPVPDQASPHLQATRRRSGSVWFRGSILATLCVTAYRRCRRDFANWTNSAKRILLSDREAAGPAVLGRLS